MKERGLVGVFNDVVCMSELSLCELFQFSSAFVYSQYFTEDSGDLWKRHCEREFRGCSPAEMESWRELYLVSSVKYVCQKY